MSVRIYRVSQWQREGVIISNNLWVLGSTWEKGMIDCSKSFTKGGLYVSSKKMLSRT